MNSKTTFRKKKWYGSLLIKGLILLVLASCQGLPTENEEIGVVYPEISEAISVLHPTAGNDARGTVTFTNVEEGLQVKVDVSGLTPGEHGFHIHKYGDCSAPDATSAEGHFNPHDKKHGGRLDEERHAGDLGNITADSNGYAKTEFVDSLITFHGENSIIGRAVVIHAGKDDLESQPTGNAGARVACGVIGISQAK